MKKTILHVIFYGTFVVKCIFSEHFWLSFRVHFDSFRAFKFGPYNYTNYLDNLLISQYSFSIVSM